MTAETERPDEKRSELTTIFVNGKRRQVAQETLSFDELVMIAYGPNPPRGELIRYTITYHEADEPDDEKELFPGQTVEVEEGMVFDVVLTDRS